MEMLIGLLIVGVALAALDNWNVERKAAERAVASREATMRGHDEYMERRQAELAKSVAERENAMLTSPYVAMKRAKQEGVPYTKLSAYAWAQPTSRERMLGY